jgi:integration host factor subunit beta
MTKADLVDEVAKLSNLTKKETELIVNTIFDSISAALARVEKVELRGFGASGAAPQLAPWPQSRPAPR